MPRIKLPAEEAFLDTLRDVYGLDNTLVREKVRALVRAVREECAKVAENTFKDHDDSCETAGNVIAAAIRRKPCPNGK